MSHAITISLKPVGFIQSSIKYRREAPKQGYEGAPHAWVEIIPAVAKGLHRITVGQEIILSRGFIRLDATFLKLHPRGDKNLPLTGVFATRSPDRPNPLGLHRVTALEIVGNRLRVAPLETIDATPVVDIKPVLSATADV